MRPAPPRGAVSAQFWLACAEFHDARSPALEPPGPRPSECPTCAASDVELLVQSAQVMPGIRRPSDVEPVRMSCWFGPGEPAHWPLMRSPRSSRNSAASPLRAWSCATSPATGAPRAFNQGPLPIRLRASVGWLPLSASRSTLKYARQVRPPAPTAAARVWQRASAPRRPPRLPVVLVELLTKKPSVEVGAAVVGVVLPGSSDLPQPPARTRASSTARLMFRI